MSKLDAGVTVEKFQTEDKEVGGLKFSHARKRHILPLVCYWGFALLMLHIFVDVGSKEPTWWVRVSFQISTMFGLLLLVVNIFFSTTELLQRNYMALLPTGILHSTSKNPVFFAWDAIEKMSIHGSGAPRRVGLHIKNGEAHRNLRIHRLIFGQDFILSLNEFECQPELSATALNYFYLHPEKRAELETEQGLILLRQVVAQGCQALQSENPQAKPPIPKP